MSALTEKSIRELCQHWAIGESCYDNAKYNDTEAGYRRGREEGQSMMDAAEAELKRRIGEGDAA